MKWEVKWKECSCHGCSQGWIKAWMAFVLHIPASCPVTAMPSCCVEVGVEASSGKATSQRVEFRRIKLNVTALVTAFVIAFVTAFVI